MLQLKVNGEFIDLGNNPQITIDEESPIFEKDSIPGGFAFPFDLPITDRNRRIFQFPERIEKAGPMVIEQGFELYHTGLLRASGTIHIKEADVSYRSYLTVGSGDFASRIKDLKLKNVDLGGVRAWVNKSEFNEEDDFTLFPIYNPIFLDGISGYNWPVNEYRLNHYEAGLFDDNGTFAICPFPFLSYLVNRIFSHYGFVVAENVLKSDPEFKKLVLYSSFDASTLETITDTVEVVLDVDPFSQADITESVNFTTTTRKMDFFNLADSMPDLLISEFLIWLKNRLNIAYAFDKFKNVRIIRRDELLKKPVGRDLSDFASGIPKVTAIEPLAGFKLKWNHDPDDELFDDTQFKEIDSNLDLYRGTVANTQVLAAVSAGINDIYFVVSLDKFFQYAYKEDVGNGSPGYSWEIWSMGFQNFWTEDGEDVFESGISTLRMVNFQRTLAGATIRCPYTKQLSNGVERTDHQPFTPRLLIYHGLQLDSNGNETPMGSSDNIDIDGAQIPDANLTLKWDGEFGVYDQLWKDYLTWWMTRKQVNWIIRDPSILDFTQKYAIDRNHYLLKKRTINYALHEIVPGECEWFLA